MKQQVSSWTFQVNKLLLHFQVLRHPQAFSFLLAWKPQTLATPSPLCWANSCSSFRSQVWGRALQNAFLNSQAPMTGSCCFVLVRLPMSVLH